MRAGGLFAAVCWLMATHAWAQEQPAPESPPPSEGSPHATDGGLPPVPPPPGSAEAQRVPPPPGSVEAQQAPPAPGAPAPPPAPQGDPYASATASPPTLAEQLSPPPPPAGYAGVPPPGPGYRTPVYAAPSVWDGERPPAARPAPTDPDRRAGSEMVELYIAGGGWGVLTGTWLVFLAGDPDDVGGGAMPILFGGGGALLVYGLDAGVGGLPKGVPASIAMGTVVGLLEGLFMLPAFDVPEEDTAVTLVWGGATLGAVTGALLGTQLRPTTGDSRLVTSVGLWGAYFTGLATLIADTSDEQATWRTILGGLNGGLLIGFLLAPASDLDGGQVMLMNAGLGIGSLGGLLVSTMIAADSGSGDLDTTTTALTVGVGAAGGLLGAYLLFGGRDPEPESERASWSPYVAPVREGAMVGFSRQLR